MAKSKAKITAELESQALMILKARKDLEASSAFKKFLSAQKKVADNIEDLKKYLKENMLNYDISSITSPNGKSDWQITLNIATSVTGGNMEEIDDYYKLKEELDSDNILIENDKIYRLVPNAKLAKNILDTTQKLPKGFIITKTPRLSIKVDGKAI